MNKALDDLSIAWGQFAAEVNRKTPFKQVRQLAEWVAGKLNLGSK